MQNKILIMAAYDVARSKYENLTVEELEEKDIEARLQEDFTDSQLISGRMSAVTTILVEEMVDKFVPFINDLMDSLVDTIRDFAEAVIPIVEQIQEYDEVIVELKHVEFIESKCVSVPKSQQVKAINQYTPPVRYVARSNLK